MGVGVIFRRAWASMDTGSLFHSGGQCCYAVWAIPGNISLWAAFVLSRHPRARVEKGERKRIILCRYGTHVYAFAYAMLLVSSWLARLGLEFPLELRDERVGFLFSSM